MDIKKEIDELWEFCKQNDRSYGEFVKDVLWRSVTHGTQGNTSWFIRLYASDNVEEKVSLTINTLKVRDFLLNNMGGINLTIIDYSYVAPRVLDVLNGK